MDILIIGGSQFVGPIVIDKLLSRGHNITVFNRGKSKTAYPAGVKFLRGDRNRGFDIHDHFDAVIDMCAYEGSQTKSAINRLDFDFFVHCSTTAVYKKTGIFPLTEESELGEWPLWGEYNQGKVECERVLADSGINYASLRPVYILGQDNPYNREYFLYSHIKKGKPLLIPGDGNATVQFVFAQDVADCFVMLAEKKKKGVFNCAGDEAISLTELVDYMGKLCGKKPVVKYDKKNDGENFDWVSFPFPNETFLCSNKKIKSCGIRFTPLFEGLKMDYEKWYSYQI